MLLQFFKHANGKFILLIFLFVLILRTSMTLFLELDLFMMLFAFLSHSISAVFINRIFTRNLITKKYSILPAFIFLLLTSSQPFLLFNTITIVFLLYSLALVGLSNIYPAERVNERLFNSGLILSISAAINPSLLLFTFPLIFIFQFFFNTNQIRLFFISLTALLIPLFIYFSFILIVFNDNLFINQLSTSFQIKTKSILPLLINLIFPLILAIVSIVDLQSHFQHKKILSRKFMLFLLFLSVMHLGLIIVTPVPLSSGIFILLPITVLLANYFEHIKAKWIHHILFILLIVLSGIIPFIDL